MHHPQQSNLTNRTLRGPPAAADTWAQALSLQSRPAAARRALQQRLDIADIIWHAAGDRSTDYNW